MEFESERAEDFFSRAAALLPGRDRRSMVAAEIMASVYHALLRRMKADRFRVFDKEYRLSKIEKSGRVAGQLLRLCLNARVK
jgi:phytoene synthase